MGKMMRSVGTVIFCLQWFLVSRTNASIVISIRYTIYVYKFTFCIKSVSQIFVLLLILLLYKLIDKPIKINRIYFFLVMLMAVLITISLVINTHYGVFQGFTDALYQVVSITTSTGSANVDFVQWDYVSKVLLFIVMFMGSCSGSAGGGIKMVRWLIVYKAMKSELLRILHPNAIINIKVDNKSVPSEVTRQIVVYVFYYFIIFGITSITIAIIEHNSTIGLAGSITALGNIGPGFEKLTGPMGSFSTIHPASKCIMIFNMLVGRLELIPFLVMLQRDFWSLKDN